ncbi:N-acyl-D-amino-acid deacylase family protein [Agromyces albus]|uniref:N-acyl-D-amino-acid deacylase family protein n=1 Tax=Agromyces albus TaxID=205332 RepID=UPI0027819B33|nr:amidohydrolase family protein [Agromyces albus]MDQ0574529.1 N-acyl-D-amino-acid deacylase [Agromyces albus]
MPHLIRNVTVVDGVGAGAAPADVLLDGELIVRIDPADSVAPSAADTVLEGAGRLLLPGFVDAHSHADALLFDPDVQLALLRQGVTTVIGGQDGVSFAPGDGSYASEYFAAINGRHPTYRGGGVAALLAGYDGTTALNAGTLVPAGTVRHVVMGRSTDAAASAELEAMTSLVADGLAAGALGLSTGLDYVPGIFAETDELAHLVEPVAAAGGVYVSHLRGGYEANSAAGVAELEAIALHSGVAVHVSHFHAAPGIVHGLLDGLAAAGVDATFDAYPYTRGCSILTMPILPAALSVQPVADVIEALADPAEREVLFRYWFPSIADYPSLGAEWPSMLTLAHIAAPEYDWAHGLTLDEAARRADTDPASFALDVLAASRLEVNVVMAVRNERSPAELASILAHPRALGGSDGIFVGAHPHPRARGTFARYLGDLVRERGALSWPEAAALCSTRAVDRFGLGRRGRIRPGWIADVVLVDPDRVADTASYESPLGLSRGIDDAFVAGVPVLAGGALSGATPGRGIRRSPALPSQPAEAEEA